MRHHESTPGMARCGRCGGENFDFARFCIICGEPLDDAPLPASASTSDLLSSPLDAPTARDRRETPQPGPSALRRWIRLEAVLGIAVLLAVIGYALYNWRVTSEQSEAYRTGAAAADRKDWDAAAQGFGRAGDFKDAAARLEKALASVDERNRLYVDGLRAALRFEWRDAASAMQAIQAIQPGFRDSAPRLDEARREILANGLGNIAYLVTVGDSPGLYVRDSAGHTTLLPGSDARSALRAISPDGAWLVYDRPTEGNVPPNQASPGFSRRTPVLVQSDGGKPLRYVPLIGLGWGRGSFAKHGLWWYSARSGEIVYTDLSDPGNPVAATVDHPGAMEVVALQAGGTQVALAEPVSGAQRGDYWKTRIYVADESGQKRRLVATVDGDVQECIFSPDGRWLLFTTQQNTANIERRMNVVDLSAQGGEGAAGDPLAGPQAQALGSFAWNGSRPAGHMSAAFLPGGGSRVIFDVSDGETESLEVSDLASGTSTLLWRGPPDDQHRRDLPALSPDGGFLSLRRGTGGNAILGAAGLTPGIRRWSSVPIEASDDQAVTAQFAGKGQQYALAVVRNPATGRQSVVARVYAAPFDAGGRLGAARLLATAVYPNVSPAPAFALPSQGEMIAYVAAGHELRAAFLDGSGDLAVASGAAAVWGLSPQPATTWVR